MNHPTAMYIVVDAATSDVLQNAVRSNITDGYAPLGGVSVLVWRGELRYFQAMLVNLPPQQSKPVSHPAPSIAEPPMEKRKPGRPKRYKMEVE